MFHRSVFATVFIMLVAVPVSIEGQCPKITNSGVLVHRLDMEAKVIRVGESVNGRLEPGDKQGEDGSYLDEWALLVCDNVRVSLSMRSYNVDAMLMLGRDWDPQDFRLITFNDDHFDSTDSLIEITLRPGVYTLVATSYFSETGGYALSVR